MKFEHQKSGTTDVLHIEGRIDAGSAPQLEKEVSALIGRGHGSVVLDLARVDYVSSAGLRVFLIAFKALAEQSRGFALAALNADVMGVVKLTGFHQILTIRDTLDAALDAVPAGNGRGV